MHGGREGEPQTSHRPEDRWGLGWSGKEHMSYQLLPHMATGVYWHNVARVFSIISSLELLSLASQILERENIIDPHRL